MHLPCAHDDAPLGQGSGELPMKVNRIAYREFSRDPDSSFSNYKEMLRLEVFGPNAEPHTVEDLLTLQAVFATERT